MTPRSVMFMLPLSTGLNDFVGALEENPFSRIPVYGENRDDITGVVLRAEALLQAVRSPGDWTLESLQREVIRTDSRESLDSLMKRFLTDGHQVTLVTDRFGTVTGLLTLEDILETVVGVEIMDESDQVADLQELARKLWRARAEKKGLDADSVQMENVETTTP